MQTPPSAVISSFEARSPEDARALIGQLAAPLTLEVVPAGAPYFCRYDVLSYGPLMVCRAFQTAGMRLGIPDLQSHYTVGFATAGRVLSHHRGARVDIAGAVALVYQPVGDIHSWSTDGSDTYTVTIDRYALEATLATLLGRSTAGPVRFGPRIDLTSAGGRSLARLTNLLATEAGNPNGLCAQASVMQPLADAVLRGLLLAADHPDREVLLRPVEVCRVAPVRRAVDAIQADPVRPLTVSSLAEIAGVSVRTLQHGFRQHLGVSPLGYLRQVRLARAHDDLRRADGEPVGVAVIAHRWGFAHLGRFAAYYRETYGCTPSETLRR